MNKSNIIKHIIDNDIEIDIKNYDDDDHRNNNYQNKINSLQYTPVLNNNNNNNNMTIINNDENIEVYDKKDHSKVFIINIINVIL